MTVMGQQFSAAAASAVVAVSVVAVPITNVPSRNVPGFGLGSDRFSMWPFFAKSDSGRIFWPFPDLADFSKMQTVYN